MNDGTTYTSGPEPRPDLLEARLGEHVWIAAAAFRVPVETLRERRQWILDQENLASISIGCYVCEEPYSDRLGYRKCPGDPNAGGRRA